MVRQVVRVLAISLVVISYAYIFLRIMFDL
jgi:hypothetical protein